MSTSGEYRALRAAVRGDAPPDTQREYAPPVDCTPHERKTDPQTMPAKKRSSDQWKFDLKLASEDLKKAADECLPKADKAYESET